jgi:energy-coupling factor transporter ATP-binding protein EcfA2
MIKAEPSPKTRPPRITVDRITISNTTFDLPEDALVILTGPNNSGKKQALKDLYGLILGDGSPQKVVKDAVIKAHFTVEEITQYIEDTFPRAINANSIQLLGYGCSKSNLVHTTSGRNLMGLAKVFAHYADTKSRLLEVEPPDAFDRRRASPEHPIQRVFASEALEKKVSALFRAAFKMDLIPHKASGPRYRCM